MKKMTHIAVLAAAFLLALATCVSAVEKGEGAIAFQGGGLFFSGKLAKLFAPDFDYGMNFAYGLSDLLAIDLDALYSAHEETDTAKFGHLSLAEAQGSIGVRASYTSQIVAPYATLAPTVMMMSYRARFPAGSRTQTDKLNSHGLGGTLTAGLDFFVSNSVTMGIAGKIGIISTDMNFATGADISNKILAFTYYSALARLTIIF